MADMSRATLIGLVEPAIQAVLDHAARRFPVLCKTRGAGPFRKTCACQNASSLEAFSRP